jgi:hypothetical protein
MRQKTKHAVKFGKYHFEHEIGTHYIWVRELEKGRDSEPVDCMSFEWQKDKTNLSSSEFWNYCTKYMQYQDFLATQN